MSAAGAIEPGVTSFGTGADGREVSAIGIAKGPLSARILTRGAILQDLRLAGHGAPLTLGSPELAAYEGPMGYFGAIVGPVANRIGGAGAEIAGRPHRFEANENGRTTLHGGTTGTHALHWEIAEATAESVTLALSLPDGLGGFPGNRRIAATYRMTDTPALHLTLTATTDAPTLMNLAHHGMWRMGGGPDWGGHVLQIAADEVLEIDSDTLPTGRLLDMTGTGFDFRDPREVKPGLTVRLDHNFCLARARRPLTPVLWLTGPEGLRLEVATTEPGLQVYDGLNAPSGDFPSHDGPAYGPFAGFAIEPQFWPDAPNHPDFPSILLNPGEDWRQETEFRLLHT